MGEVAVDGTVNACCSYSDAVVPLPPSQSFHEPLWAGRPVLFVMGPDVPVQPVWPDSKPPLTRLELGGGVVPPQVSLPAGTEMPLNAFSMPVHSALPAP